MPSTTRETACTTVDLTARSARARSAVSQIASAPVRHLPAALLEALQGSWGTPEELLGVDRLQPRAGAR